MKKNIPALKISMEQKECDDILESIRSILYSDIKWTNSTYVALAEEKFSSMLHIPYCAMTSTGSSAIEAVLISLDVEDTCIFAPVLTAPATIYSCLNCNSDIVLVDSDVNNFSINILDLEEKIKTYYVGKYSKKGAIIVVHVGGIITSYIEEIRRLADEYDLYLIEDCAHAHGSKYNEKSAGFWGIAATYSFFLTKTITSGEGGAVVSKDKGIIDKIKEIRNYGKSPEGRHIIKGSSWRMNEFTAAVLYNRLKNYNPDIRNHIVAKYNNALVDSPYFRPINLPEYSVSGYYKYIVYLKNETTINIDNLKRQLKDNGIELPARVFEIITVEEPYLNTHNLIINANADFSNARFLSQNHICLPIYEQLTDFEIEYIVDMLQLSLVKN